MLRLAELLRSSRNYRTATPPTIGDALILLRRSIVRHFERG